MKKKRQSRYEVSQRRACHVFCSQRSTQRYKSGSRRDDSLLRMRIREIAQTRLRFGYRRIHVMLLREGWAVNHKRVARIYREEGLNLREKRYKKNVRECALPRPKLPSPMSARE